METNVKIPSPADLEKQATIKTLDDACQDIVAALTRAGSAKWNVTGYSLELRELIKKHFVDAGWSVAESMDELNSWLEITKPAKPQV